MAKNDVENAVETVAPVQPATPASVRPKFKYKLQVRNPFASYTKGHVFATDEAIQSVIDSDNIKNCNRVAK